MSPTSEGCLILLNPAEIWLTPTLHFDRQSVSSIIKPTFTLSSSACFFHVLFNIPFYLWPSTSISNFLLKTYPSSLLNTWPSSLLNSWPSSLLNSWPSSLLNTWPCQCTLFAITNWSMVSFKPWMSIKYVDRFLSLRCTPHIALTMDLSGIHKMPISLFLRHNDSLLCSIAGLT